jgi:hypothetical protein
MQCNVLPFAFSCCVQLWEEAWSHNPCAFDAEKLTPLTAASAYAMLLDYFKSHKRSYFAREALLASPCVHAAGIDVTYDESRGWLLVSRVWIGSRHRYAYLYTDLSATSLQVHECCRRLLQASVGARITECC